MNRSERAERVAALRAQGRVYREIAAELGISLSYAGELVRDPDGREARARKDSYRGTCEVCGATTDGSWGRKSTPTRRCAKHPRQLWDREAILERIRTWADLYGSPPAATDWNPSMAEKQGRPDVAIRFRVDGCWPHTATVQERFGSWNAAIEAAGFPPRRPGQRGNRGGRYEVTKPIAVPLAGVES